VLFTQFEREFSAIKNSVTVDDAFILNVIQNPHLSPLDMRLAFYFYHKEMAANYHLSLGNGNTFIIEEGYSKKQLKKLIGSSGTLHYSTDVFHYIQIDKIILLVEDLKNSNVDVGLTELKTSIQTLSNFAYITVTPISWEYAHVRYSRTAKAKMKANIEIEVRAKIEAEIRAEIKAEVKAKISAKYDERIQAGIKAKIKDELTRVYAQHIRIFSRMSDKLIFKTIKEDP